MEVKAVTRNKKEATSFPRSIGDILMKARTRSSSLFYFTSCRAMPASYVHLWEGGLHSAVQQRMMFVDYNLWTLLCLVPGCQPQELSRPDQQDHAAQNGVESAAWTWSEVGWPTLHFWLKRVDNLANVPVSQDTGPGNCVNLLQCACISESAHTHTHTLLYLQLARYNHRAGATNHQLKPVSYWWFFMPWHGAEAEPRTSNPCQNHWGAEWHMYMAQRCGSSQDQTWTTACDRWPGAWQQAFLWVCEDFKSAVPK